MAFLLDINTRCQAQGCVSAAKVELIDWRNEPRGKFCTKHGKQQLKERLKFEVENPSMR